MILFARPWRSVGGVHRRGATWRSWRVLLFTRPWRVLLACVLTAAGLGLWLLQRSATAECRLVPVGGKANGCHCTQRIEP
jgi:hypothetical protein